MRVGKCESRQVSQEASVTVGKCESTRLMAIGLVFLERFRVKLLLLLRLSRATVVVGRLVVADVVRTTVTDTRRPAILL